jgi:hypothetical protein
LDIPIFPKCQLLEFDGVISESTKEDLIRLFSETTPFEWEEEYLIIHFDKNGLVEGRSISISKFRILLRYIRFQHRLNHQ